MDGLTLIRAARALGLTVRADGDRLVVRGPRRESRVAQALIARKSDVLPVITAATRWPRAAEERFVERLAIADDLGADASPGSPAWDVAVREARRVAAGIPERLRFSRGPDLVDHALAAFEPLGGLRFVASTPKEGQSS